MQESERRRDEEYIDGLLAALIEIAEWGAGQGVIPCPQDYEFYIRPMRERADQALHGSPDPASLPLAEKDG